MAAWVLQASSRTCKGKSAKPKEYFLSQLEAHFGQEEAQSQLETAINWGRYVELFTFQEDRGIFRLEEPEAAETA